MRVLVFHHDACVLTMGWRAHLIGAGGAPDPTDTAEDGVTRDA